MLCFKHIWGTHEASVGFPLGDNVSKYFQMEQDKQSKYLAGVLQNVH